MEKKIVANIFIKKVKENIKQFCSGFLLDSIYSRPPQKRNLTADKNSFSESIKKKKKKSESEILTTFTFNKLKKVFKLPRNSNNNNAEQKFILE